MQRGLVTLALVALIACASPVYATLTISTSASQLFPWSNVDVEVTAASSNFGITDIICQAGNLEFERNRFVLSFVLTNEGVYPIRCTAVGAGIFEEATLDPPVRIDKTPPVVTFSPSPNANGWFNTVPLTIHYQTSDALAGPDTPADGNQGVDNPTGDFVFTHDGTGQTFSVTVRDQAGNRTQATFIGSIDTFPPAYRIDYTPRQAFTGWNKSDVRVVVTPVDDFSGPGQIVVNGVASDVFDQTFTSEGVRSLTITASDRAGNTTTGTELVKIDKTPPVVTITRNPLANAEGWNNTPVTVTFTATDANGLLCGPFFNQICPTLTQTFTFDANSNAFTQPALFIDAAINEVTASAVMKIDKDAPVVSVTRSPQPNANGWNNSDVHVHIDVFDQLSGLVAGQGPFDATFGQGLHDVVQSFRDRAGNQTNVEPFRVSVDKVPPQLIETRTSPFAPNANGWFNQPVTVSFFGADDLSGLATNPLNVLLSSEGAQQIAAAFLIDRAGNVTGVSNRQVNIDMTPPTVSTSQSPGPNAYGWNNSDVSVAFSATDALSGVAPNTGSTIVTTEGTSQPIRQTFTDRAGNSRIATASVSIDKTPPNVICSAAPSLIWPPNHQLVPVTMQTFFDDGDQYTVGRSGGPVNGILLQSLTSSVPNSGDIVGWDIGTPDTFGQLLAWRASQLPVYTFFYTASDLAGNAGNCTAQVAVGR